MNIDIRSRVVRLGDDYHAIATIKTNKREHVHMKAFKSAYDAFSENLRIHSELLKISSTLCSGDPHDDPTEEVDIAPRR